MPYNAGDYIPNYHNCFSDNIREIRKKESAYRDIKAREMIEKLNKERKEKGITSSRHPVLVCRRMEHLPKPGIR